MRREIVICHRCGTRTAPSGLDDAGRHTPILAPRWAFIARAFFGPPTSDGPARIVESIDLCPNCSGFLQQWIDGAA